MGNIVRAIWRTIERASSGLINRLVRKQELSFGMSSHSGGPLPSQRDWRRSLVKSLLSLKWVPVVNRRWRSEMLRIADSLRTVAQTHAHSTEELLAVLADRAASHGDTFAALDVLHRKGVRVEPSTLRALLAEGKCSYLAAHLLVTQTGKEDADLLFGQWEAGRFRDAGVLDILFRADPERAEAAAREELARGSHYAVHAADLLWPLGRPDDERLIRLLLDRTGDPTEKSILGLILSSPRKPSQCGA